MYFEPYGTYYCEPAPIHCTYVQYLFCKLLHLFPDVVHTVEGLTHLSGSIMQVTESKCCTCFAGKY